jgi:hypothetical protein
MCYALPMRYLLGTLALLLLLAACEGTSVHGSASEHGVRNVRVGVPL